jgi:acetyl esterase/lipase
MAARGLAVAAVDYRLSGEARFPAQPDDVRAACRWLLDDVASPVRALPLVLFGVSAGGQVAALCGLDPELPVQAVALWYPATDLPAMPDDIEAAGGTADRAGTSREALMLGASAAQDPEKARLASPVTHVRGDAPPFLLLHGDADLLVPAQQSRRLHDALQAAGASATLELVAGYNHMFAGMPDVQLEALLERTTTFLLEQALPHAGSHLDEGADA